MNQIRDPFSAEQHHCFDEQCHHIHHIQLHVGVAVASGVIDSYADTLNRSNGGRELNTPTPINSGNQIGEKSSARNRDTAVVELHLHLQDIISAVDKVIGQNPEIIRETQKLLRILNNSGPDAIPANHGKFIGSGCVQVVRRLNMNNN